MANLSIVRVLFYLAAVASATAANKPQAVAPAGALGKLRAEVQKLRDRAKARSMMLEHDLKLKRADNDKAIALQEAKNQILEKSNEGLRGRISKLEAANEQRRALVQKVSEELGDGLNATGGLQAQLANASAAIEAGREDFTALLAADRPELAVLSELDAEANRKREQREHTRSLRVIARERVPPNAALLQTETDSAPPSPDQAAKLLAKLTASLENLEKEGNTTRERIGSEFREKSAVLELQAKRLLGEQADLQAKMAKEANISAKLDSVLKQLSKTRELVRSRNKGLRQYVRKLAVDAPAPSTKATAHPRLAAARRGSRHAGRLPRKGRRGGAKVLIKNVSVQNAIDKDNVSVQNATAR